MAGAKLADSLVPVRTLNKKIALACSMGPLDAHSCQVWQPRLPQLICFPCFTPKAWIIGRFMTLNSDANMKFAAAREAHNLQTSQEGEAGEAGEGPKSILHSLDRWVLPSHAWPHNLQIRNLFTALCVLLPNRCLLHTSARRFDMRCGDIGSDSYIEDVFDEFARYGGE